MTAAEPDDTSPAGEDAADTEEPEVGHLRQGGGKRRSDKAIRAGAVAMLEVTGELFANRVQWSADPARVRNVVACLYHVGAVRKRVGFLSLLVARVALDRALPGDAGAWVPKDREEVAELLKRALGLVAEVPILPPKQKRTAFPQPLLLASG